MSEHSERLIQPEPPDELKKETRQFWREVGQTMVRESIAAIDESARQIIGVAGILEGLYFHAIAYSDLRGQVAGTLPWAIYLAPIVLLLLALVAGLAIYFPDRYRVNIHSSDASRRTYERVVASKLRLLKLASMFLVLGVGAVLLAVILYLQTPPPPSP
jgi:hypothetical protein